MAFFPPIPLIRKNHIVKQLHSCGAVSEETDKTLELLIQTGSKE